MENAEALIAAVIVPAVLLILFCLFAWKTWQGKWLRLIAGNNFIPEEEYDSPEQRRLGKRMSVVMISWCPLFVASPVWTIGTDTNNAALTNVGIFFLTVAGVLVVAVLVWFFVVQGRDNRKAREEELLKHPERIDDAKLDRRATIVLVVILVVYLSCILFASLQAAT